VTIDERLRRGLRARLDPGPTPGLDVRAGRVIERARRRTVARRLVTGVAIAAAVALVAVAGPRALELGGADRPAVRPTPVPSVAPQPTTASGVPSGSYRLTIPHDGRDGRANRLGAAGRWTLTIQPHETTLARDGEPPAAGPVADVDGVLVTFVMNCGLGPGRYAWGLRGSTLLLSLVSDPCPLRRYVLMGGGPGNVGWTVVLRDGVTVPGE
jgi:hypothetical protein